MIFSFIIPCYNEEGNIRPMYDEIQKVFSDRNFEYELIFVNDGSRDNTANEIKKVVKEGTAQVAMLDFSRNFGKEAAIFAGLEHCKGDFAVIIDGDLQQPPAVALEMLDILLKNPDCDCVCAYQDSRIENRFTSFLKKSFYKVINGLSQVTFVPDASDFRVMRRNMIDAVLSMKENVRFSKGIFAWVGFHTEYIPYHAQERNAGTTKWNTCSLFRYAFDGIVSFSAKPLKIPGRLSFLSFAAALIYLIVMLCNGSFSEVSAAIFVVLLMSGVVLFGLSIVCTYLGRSYAESKHRPIYILCDEDKNFK